MVESETDLSKAEKQVKGGRSLTEERNFEKKKKKNGINGEKTQTMKE